MNNALHNMVLAKNLLRSLMEEAAYCHLDQLEASLTKCDEGVRDSVIKTRVWLKEKENEQDTLPVIKDNDPPSS